MKKKIKVLFIILLLGIGYDLIFTLYNVWGKWQTYNVIYAVLKVFSDLFLIWFFLRITKKI